MTINRPGLLIFDLDGTLFRTETVSVPAVQMNFARWGLPIPASGDIMPLMGTNMEEFSGWIRRSCPPDAVGNLLSAIARSEIDLIGESGQMYEGISNSLAVLCEAGFEMALCSYGPADYVMKVVETFRLTEFFDAVRPRAHRGETKSLMVEELADRFHSRPGIVIGDLGLDIDAAHTNGFFGVAALYGHGDQAELAAADATVWGSDELVSAILRLARWRPP